MEWKVGSEETGPGHMRRARPIEPGPKGGYMTGYMTGRNMNGDPSRSPQRALAARPDPGDAATPQELVRRLRALKAWSGNPSLRELERRTGVPRSTISGDLSPRRDRLPPLQRVSTLVTAFGASAEELARWRCAWQRIEMRQQAAEPPVPAPHAAVAPPASDLAPAAPGAPPQARAIGGLLAAVLALPLHAWRLIDHSALLQTKKAFIPGTSER